MILMPVCYPDTSKNPAVIPLQLFICDIYATFAVTKQCSGGFGFLKLPQARIRHNLPESGRVAN